jgi:beta-galactosidase
MGSIMIPAFKEFLKTIITDFKSFSRICQGTGGTVMKKIMAVLLLAVLLTGCGGEPASTEPVTQPAETVAQTLPAPAVEAEAAALAQEVPPPTGVVLEPVAPGEREDRCDAAVVDYSNAEDGYVMVFYYGETEKRLKVLLRGPRTTYNYDLPRGSWTVLPLSDGDGTYEAGIYRNVHIVVTDDVHIPMWGTQLTTPRITNEYAEVLLRTSICYPEGVASDDLRIVTEISNPRGEVVASAEGFVSRYDSKLFEQRFDVANPELWSVNTPLLYSARSQVYLGDELKDEYTTRFGIRHIEIIPDKGMFINGVPTKFKGVCNHHDLGPLGAAVNDAAIRRQIRILKDMGCNAIRTSHNMPAPELVEACDEMGMLLMLETFDEWQTPKVKNGYHKYFDEWAERDLVNLIHHFRNNPSVVMWCIGNEVPDQGDKLNGPKLSRWLQDICHREDPTRPVTQGMDQPHNVVYNNMAAVMDVAGFNYRPHLYGNNYYHLPQQIILGSETASTVSSRGVYKFPVERRSMAKYEDHQASSYDVEHCGWSNLPEDDWMWHEDYDCCIGEFVWTGFDYLGEPTPYYSDWPSHSSLFGIVDLAGLPKDRYYLYRSHWNREEETLHMLPHWTWPGREGEVTPVFVYTNYPSAELFVNGVSQGVRTKDSSITIEDTMNPEAEKALKRQERYRLMWMDVKYEPGTVKVVAYNEAGEAVAEQEIRTAGAPHHIELSVDRASIKADGRDLAFVTVSVVDKDGNLCPMADNQITYTVKGAGRYRAGANGDPTSLELFHEPRMRVFSGMMTAIVESSESAGTITLTAKAKGLKSATITIKSE